jgi:hypothetical protein
MSLSKKILISSSIIIFSLFIFIFFRTVPVSKAWKGYTMIYAKSQALTESQILEYFYNNGCQNIISRYNQSIPVFSNLAPIQVQSPDSYIFKRLGFFTDSTQQYFVFYINENQTKHINQALIQINRSGLAQAQSDTAKSFPWFMPVIVLAFCAVLIYFSKNKYLFASSIVPVCVLAFSRPLYTFCSALMLLSLTLFLIQKIWGRRGFFNDKKNGIYLLPLIAGPLVFLAFSSLVSSIFYILCLICSSACVYLYQIVYSYFEQKRASSFNFVLIKGSSSIRLIDSSNIRVFGVFGLLVLIVLLLSIFSTVSNPVFTDLNRPLLPSPVKSYSTDLPSLDEFENWSWNTITFPYKKLNEANKASERGTERGATIHLDDYTLLQTGKIQQTNSKVLTFDSSFVDTIYDKVKKLDYPAIEKLMIKQGKNSYFAYTKNSGSSHERAGLFVILLLALGPALLCLHFWVGKKQQWL